MHTLVVGAAGDGGGPQVEQQEHIDHVEELVRAVVG
jgi:hypothetical protein